MLVLLTDLFEGGNKENMIRRVATLVSDGVQIVALLALNDHGAPRFDRQVAQELVNLGVPAFACTPQLFPDLMGAVLNGRDLRHWAATHNIVTAQRTINHRSRRLHRFLLFRGNSCQSMAKPFVPPSRP